MIETTPEAEIAPKSATRTRILAISLSFVISIGLMAVKFFVYHLTGSSAILSDALESIINVVASAFALGSIIMAAKPPDESHPYGHGKIEYFSAGFEGALIVLAAIGIFKVGVENLFFPRPLPKLEMGLLILLGAGVVNLLLGVVLIRVGRSTRSLALAADGRHVLTDVYTTGGVLVGLYLVGLTGWFWMDGLIACLVGVNIIFSGVGLMRESFAGLMDASDPRLLGEITNIVSENRRPAWIDIHQLRAWRSGSDIHIDLHLILHRETTLENAHREGKILEELFNSHFDGAANTLVHLDPCVDEECPVCGDVCNLRHQEFQARLEWNRENLTSMGGAGERFKRMTSQPESTGNGSS